MLGVVRDSQLEYLSLLDVQSASQELLRACVCISNADQLKDIDAEEVQRAVLDFMSSTLAEQIAQHAFDNEIALDSTMSKRYLLDKLDAENMTAIMPALTRKVTGCL